MKFLLLGATGATGRLFTDLALAAGHEVTAVVRAEGSLTASPGLTVVVGDVRDASSLQAAMSGADVAVSTIGLGTSRTPGDLVRDTSAALVEAAGRSRLSKVVFMSSFGVGESLAKGSFVLRLLYRGGRATFADKAAGEQVLRSSELDWTVVYPGLLTNKAATGQVRAQDLTTIARVPGVPRISRADVAAFLLDAATGSRWSRRTVVLTVGT